MVMVAESRRLYALSKDLLQRLMMEKSLGEESEDEMELNLGLSLGGCLGKPRKSRAFKNQQPDLQRKGDGGLKREDSHGHGLGSANFGGAVEFGFGGKEESGQREVARIQESEPTKEMMEQQNRRELHARRRQEARKKREEKQRARRGGGGGGIRPVQSNKGRNGFVPLAPFPMRGGSVFPMRVGSGGGVVVPSEEDKRVFGAQMASTRNKQRAVKESEPCGSTRKEGKAVEQRDPSIDDKSSIDNMVCSANGGEHPASNEDPSGPCPETNMDVSYPGLPMSCSFPPQCLPVPMGMGFSFPYMMPFWPAPKSGGATPPLPPNVLQPIPTRAFPPFQMPLSQPSCYANAHPRRGTGNAHSSHASGASSGRSSSAVSDYESRSSQGASSNDTKSQSSTSSVVERERLQRGASISKTQDQTMGSSEVSTASEIEPLKSAQLVATDKVANNADQSAMASQTTTMHGKHMTEASYSTKALTTHKNTETAKDGHCPSLPNMPCVSTTGEGGKTVNGFLYRYTEEVSIVCVCHGTFLSPAEFVQHAGGTDISHPLRHIIVNPSLSAMQYTSTMS